jgi:DNA-binding MarR family transcriptional regulator
LWVARSGPTIGRVGQFSPPAVPARSRTAIDRVLEVFERRGLSPSELRLLLRLLDREASLSELADALGKRPSEMTRVGGRLATRGLIRWCHVGPRGETRLAITEDGAATMSALLAAADRAAAA